MLVFSELIKSPAVPGLIFIIVSFITRAFPPKKINSFYGYRTGNSKRNEHNWRLGNQYSTGIMLKSGIVLMAVGMLMAFFGASPFVMAITTTTLSVVAALVIVLLTERQIKLQEPRG